MDGWLDGWLTYYRSFAASPLPSIPAFHDNVIWMHRCFEKFDVKPERREEIEKKWSPAWMGMKTNNGYSKEESFDGGCDGEPWGIIF